MQQEEGWVVCRAFKKPNPSNKPGFEAWNKTYYTRDSSNYRFPSYPSTPTVMPCFDPSSLNQGTSLHQPSFPPGTLKSNLSPFESQMVDLPNLDSPSISTSFATNDTNLEHSAVATEEAEDEKSYFTNQFSEWKSFDKLLASSSSSSYTYGTNMPFVPDSGDLDAQNHLSHVLECFPDL